MRSDHLRMVLHEETLECLHKKKPPMQLMIYDFIIVSFKIAYHVWCIIRHTVGEKHTKQTLNHTSDIKSDEVL